VNAGADLAAVHMDELRLLLWAEWWFATLGRGRWWLALGAQVRKLFWRGAREFIVAIERLRLKSCSQSYTASRFTGGPRTESGKK
jgi:hypothetical protein